LINLFRYRPKIVHACDVDTVVACYLYKRLGRNTLVFDLFDRFSLSITKPKIAILVLRSLEEFFSYRADTFVTNSIKLYNTFNRKPKNYAIIMNCPNDEPKTQNCDMPRSQFFKLVFAGYISPERGLEQVAKAILGQEKIKLVVAGQATDNEYIARLKNYSNIEYLGCLQYDEAMCLQSGADAIIIPYDPQLPMNRIGTPNKLFDAMMLGIPVITTVCREIVEETMCGIFVAFEPGSIRDAISRLSNYPFLREEMGINGRKAFENKYNWSLMEKRLLGLYDDLSARRKTKKPTRQKHALTSMRARWPKLWLTKFAEKRQLLLCLSKRP
jgi:glycosyltransferase involved in cell wall biosynthesis